MPIDSDVFFEYANMEEVFMKNQSLPSDDFLDELIKELTAFTKTDSFDDDICLICVDVV